MRICFFTTYFYPEEFKGNDLAFELAKKGHEITVITAIPNYPLGKFYEGYSFFKRRREIVNNVNVIRLPVIPRGSGSAFRLIINYTSFLLTSVFFTFIFCFYQNFDVIFVQQLSPFFIAVPSIIMKKIQRIPLYLWVLDLWPESVQSTTGFNNRVVLYFLDKMVVGVYKRCTNILIGSEGYKKAINSKGCFNDKLIYFPNWAEEVLLGDPSSINLNMIAPFSSLMEDDFILLFAGNLGEAQNLGKLIEAAKLTERNRKIKWVFLGDGRYRNTLEKKVREYNLRETVFFPGRYPLDTMPAFMEKADILLVSLKDALIFNLTIPSKVQFYMAQSKPILGMLNGEGADIIAKAQCGFCVPAGDYETCAKLINDLYVNRTKLKNLGQNGKDYYAKHFQKKDRVQQLESLLVGRQKA